MFAKGDDQLGHATCDESRILKDIEWVKENPHCLLALLGDGIDSATKTSPGSLRDNTSTPLRQVERYITIHKPVADRIIGYVGGNHERRIDKALDDPGAAIRLISKGLSSLVGGGQQIAILPGTSVSSSTLLLGGLAVGAVLLIALLK